MSFAPRHFFGPIRHGRRGHLLAKAIQLKPEEHTARSYADRLILGKLIKLQSAIKLSELAELLQGTGIGLSALRSLLGTNPDKFAYHERRWVPAARLEGTGRPYAEAMRLIVDRFGGPMPVELLAEELALAQGKMEAESIESIRRMAESHDHFIYTASDEIALSRWVFVTSDEKLAITLERNQVTPEQVEALEAPLAGIDWRSPEALQLAVQKCAPVSVKALGAYIFSKVNSDDPRSTLMFDWKAVGGALLSQPKMVYSSDGMLHPEEDAKKWISAAVKLAEKIAPSVEIEDAAPIEVKSDDVDRMVAKWKTSPDSLTATQLLEEFYEITPSVKTFPDDMANLMAALKARPDAWWVGGDRFRVPGTAPDFINDVPEVFLFEKTSFTDEEGDPIDVEVNDDGLSSTLRKLLSHPLATDVLDEEELPAPKSMAEQLRLVLKPIHRELGTFPICQFPTGWITAEPKIQELTFIDPQGRELQVWANMEARLLFGLIDWWYEQPIESGAVFSLTRTHKQNVFEFAWLDQPDPVVYISNQRMEELRAIQERAAELSTHDVLKEVMAHWPKGADFLTILWEVNVVRRVPRRLIASLLSSYHCYYQRSGSPVWHFDNKKVEQGIDKTKKKFILK
ncbi:MAG TPA: hypothetical protein PKY51_01550 [Fimbriimonadaceae bacterium]|nr:hypothetical protein [Fimbriimonadaceae bacterium]